MKRKHILTQRRFILMPNIAWTAWPASPPALSITPLSAHAIRQDPMVDKGPYSPSSLTTSDQLSSGSNSWIASTAVAVSAPRSF